MTLHDIFHERLPIIAPLALRPLPGSPRYGGSLDAVIERALADLTVLELHSPTPSTAVVLLSG